MKFSRQVVLLSLAVRIISSLHTQENRDHDLLNWYESKLVWNVFKVYIFYNPTGLYCATSTRYGVPSTKSNG